MPLEIKWDVSGLDALDDLLNDLGTILGSQAAKKAARKAMKPVHDEVIATAPRDLEDDGVHLNENIKLRVGGRTKADDKAGNNTFVRAEVYTKGAVNIYAAQVEFGRPEYVTERTMLFGKPTRLYKITVGEQKEQPFMRNALRNHATLVVDTFKNELTAEITKIATQSKTKRANKKINSMYNQSKKKAGTP
ncbi:HK97-gp10 family putative phage morphogenesis protein [Aeromonas caviae]|uniref:HK97-gp10 family putative phage morphogenesis protein n=1 Tax=Aeromonas caviae TaxID=648 RepID=UPI0022549D04|nr:HK97-gp10 family putative phage morphogenesis protein [Aeromonas caviae]MCX4071935.1 HK97 gp10 family phage protein [Aeromonas caviae]